MNRRRATLALLLLALLLAVPWVWRELSRRAARAALVAELERVLGKASASAGGRSVPGLAPAGDRGEAARLCEDVPLDAAGAAADLAALHGWLEEHHPVSSQPEAVVDAPWNWGLNHPPIVFPYLHALEPWFRSLDRVLAGPGLRFEDPGDPRSVRLRSVGAHRWNRLLVARAWKAHVTGEGRGGAVARIASALLLALRLDRAPMIVHRVQLEGALRAIGALRFVSEGDAFDPEGARQRLDPLLRALESTRRFGAILEQERRDGADTIAGRLDDPPSGIAAWWRRPAVLRADRRLLERYARAISLAEAPYPEASRALRGLRAGILRGHERGGSWQLASHLLVHELETEARAQAALARLALGLLEHREETGHLPGELEDAASRFPDGMPRDPRTGEPFGYAFHEDGSVSLVPAPASGRLPRPGRADPPRAWVFPPGL